MATLQLRAFQTLWRNQHRYGLESWPLINIGDGGAECCVDSASLIRFSGWVCRLMLYIWQKGKGDGKDSRKRANQNTKGVGES